MCDSDVLGPKPWISAHRRVDAVAVARPPSAREVNASPRRSNHMCSGATGRPSASTGTIDDHWLLTQIERTASAAPCRPRRAPGRHADKRRRPAPTSASCSASPPPPKVVGTRVRPEPSTCPSMDITDALHAVLPRSMASAFTARRTVRDTRPLQRPSRRRCARSPAGRCGTRDRGLCR